MSARPKQKPKLRIVKKVALDDLTNVKDALDALPDQNAEPPEGLTDAGNARRLVRLHGKDFRYSPSLGWLVWDGTRWCKDTERKLMQLAKNTAQSILIEAANEKDDTRRQALAKHAAKSEGWRALEAMIELAKSEPGVYVADASLDADLWALNVKNGTNNLKTGKLRLHRREDLITKIAPVAYDPKAKAPTFEKFVNRIFGGNKNLIEFVQRALGYSMTGMTREKALFYLYGVLGNNGKSTLVEAIADIFGDYAHKTRIETFMASPSRGAGPAPERIALRGSRFVRASEVPEGQRLDESFIKDVTGGIDKLYCRDLYKGGIEFRPELKLWVYGNHRPVMRGDDSALWNRVFLIPFDVSIPLHEQDKNLPEKLAAERSGILNWLIAGCLAWQRKGLAPPNEVRMATESYREEMDRIGQFIAECCKKVRGKKTPVADLYDAYAVWCKNSGVHPESKNKFSSRLEARGFKRVVMTGNAKGIEGLDFRGIEALGMRP